MGFKDWLAGLRGGEDFTPAPGPYIFIDAYTTGQREWIGRFLLDLELSIVTVDEISEDGRVSAHMYRQVVEHAAFIILVVTRADVGLPTSGPTEGIPQRNAYLRDRLSRFKKAVGLEYVWALYQDGVTLPAEFNALPISRPDGPAGWIFLLARQLKDAGFDFPMGHRLDDEPPSAS